MISMRNKLEEERYSIAAKMKDLFKAKVCTLLLIIVCVIYVNTILRTLSKISEEC